MLQLKSWGYFCKFSRRKKREYCFHFAFLSFACLRHVLDFAQSIYTISMHIYELFYVYSTIELENCSIEIDLYSREGGDLWSDRWKEGQCCIMSALIFCVWSKINCPKPLYFIASLDMILFYRGKTVERNFLTFRRI